MNDFVWTAGSNPAIERATALEDTAIGTAIGLPGLAVLEEGEMGMLNGATGAGESDFLAMLLARKDIYCGRACKSIGYSRRVDRVAWKKCKAVCKVNFKGVKAGSYKLKPYVAEEDIEIETPIEGAGRPDMLRADMDGVNGEAKKPNTGMIIGIVIALLVMIVLAVFLFRKKKG